MTSAEMDQLIGALRDRDGDKLCLDAADTIAEMARRSTAMTAAPQLAPASCTACIDSTDCSSVDVCNAIEQVYATPAQPGDVRDALKPFAEYQLRMVAFAASVKPADLHGYQWVACFDGPVQPEFRHFSAAKAALSAPSAAVTDEMVERACVAYGWERVNNAGLKPSDLEGLTPENNWEDADFLAGMPVQEKLRSQMRVALGAALAPPRNDRATPEAK